MTLKHPKPWLSLKRSFRSFSFQKLNLKSLTLAGALTAFTSLSAMAVEPLSVSGNRILAGGEVASFAGMSLFWSNNGWEGAKFYNANTVSTLKNEWGADLVRAAMGVDLEDSGSWRHDRASNEARVRAIVDAAIANDMYVIIDWHSHYAHRDNWDDPKDFFKRMAQTYGTYPNVIYEIYNEPKDDVTWPTVKAYAQTIVEEIRKYDSDNLIIVGTTRWAQDVDVASRDPVPGNNIAYTLHFYAASHKEGLRAKAQEALNNGVALFVTEWGTVDYTGDGGVDANSTNTWMDFLKANHISHANWSYVDKNEGAAALTPGGQLTTSGALVKGIIQNWNDGGGGGGGCDGYVNVPATIQAEDYCDEDDVQTEPTTDTGGGTNVGWIDTGDWMTYNINVPTASTYKVSYRVASVSGATLQLEKSGGAPVYGFVDIPATGGWQQWTTVSHEVSLPAGQQTIAISAVSSGWNINWFKIENTGGGCTNCNEPIVIQAESFDAAATVQTEPTSDTGGGLNVGWIDAGDWMSYHDVNIPESGSYTIQYRVASQSGGGSLKFEKAGGSPVYGQLSVPSTGGWQNWQTISHTVNLSAGVQNFGIAATGGGWNLNWFSITKN